MQNNNFQPMRIWQPFRSDNLIKQTKRSGRDLEEEDKH